MNRLTKDQLLEKIGSINRHLLYENEEGNFIEGHTFINNLRYEYVIRHKMISYYFAFDPERIVFSKRLSHLTRAELRWIFDDASDIYDGCDHDCPCREELFQ